MEYWNQIVAFPTLLLGPVVVAAIVSGAVTWFATRSTRLATSADVDRKIAAERLITDLKLTGDRDAAVGDRAWIDYGLRRDIYLELAENIDALMQPGDAVRHRAFMITTRKVRLVGSDDVVRALNALTKSIREGRDEAERARCYSSLFSAVRVDIRTLNETPAVGTRLNEDAFPIES